MQFEGQLNEKFFILQTQQNSRTNTQAVEVKQLATTRNICSCRDLFSILESA
jgi:hypothetical protein